VALRVADQSQVQAVVLAPWRSAEAFALWLSLVLADRFLALQLAFVVLAFRSWAAPVSAACFVSLRQVGAALLQLGVLLWLAAQMQVQHLPLHSPLLLAASQAAVPRHSTLLHLAVQRVALAAQMSAPLQLQPLARANKWVAAAIASAHHRLLCAHFPHVHC